MESKSQINRLPVTRKALFKDILRNRWRILLSSGLLLCLFLVPLLVSSFFKDYMTLNLLNNEAYYVDGAFTEEGALRFRSINTIFLFANCVSILVLFVYFSGAFRIFRQLVWGEGINFFSDFSKGIKQNVWMFLKYGVLTVLLYFTVWSMFYFASNLLFAFIAIGVATFVFVPLVVSGMYYSSIYNTSFGQRIHNVPVLYIKNAILVLLVSLLFEAFFFLELIPSIYVITKQAIILVACFLVLPIAMLVGSLINVYIFDKDINIKNHPEI